MEIYKTIRLVFKGVHEHEMIRVYETECVCADDIEMNTE